MTHLDPPSPADVSAARERIRGGAVRTPLVRLNVDAPVELWVKLENLQPIGSFKLRGALNAIRSIAASEVADGVYTASAGNMAQGVAWGARELGVPCTVVVPEQAPQTKIDAITQLGGTIMKLPYSEWWQVLVDHRREGVKGRFIHPVSDARVIAGNATIGAEIMEDLADVTRVFVPYGGGGLSTGIAAAIHHVNRRVKVFGCEVETAAPFRASLDAGGPAKVDYTPSFVDGIGGRTLLAEMWPLAINLLTDSIVVSVAQVAEAVRQLVTRARVVPEGAGATGVAAALSVREQMFTSGEKWVAVVSGGNIDVGVLCDILSKRI